jgi:hypothetical protein
MSQPRQRKGGLFLSQTRQESRSGSAARRQGTLLLAKSSRYDKDQPLVKKGDLDGYGNKISSPSVETKILQKYFKKQDMKNERVSYREGV